MAAPLRIQIVLPASGDDCTGSPVREVLMNPLACALVGAIVVGVLTATAVESSPAQKHQKHRQGWTDGSPDVAVHVSFSPRDVRVIREYYAPRYRRLPPGLQKKLYRTGQLPPGWQKKFEPFPVVVERELVVLPHGYRRGVIDGHAVVFDPRTLRIVDVAVVF